MLSTKRLIWFIAAIATCGIFTFAAPGLLPIFEPLAPTPEPEPAAAVAPATVAEPLDGPVLTTDRQLYSPGDTMTITAAGFAANEWVTVEIFQGEIANPNAIKLDSHPVQADANGGFTDFYVFGPDAKPGSDNIRATGQTSGLVATKRIIDPPSITLYPLAPT